jgi:hypothetical protein
MTTVKQALSCENSSGFWFSMYQKTSLFCSLVRGEDVVGLGRSTNAVYKIALLVHIL